MNYLGFQKTPERPTKGGGDVRRSGLVFQPYRPTRSGILFISQRAENAARDVLGSKKSVFAK